MSRRVFVGDNCHEKRVSIVVGRNPKSSYTPSYIHVCGGRVPREDSLNCASKFANVILSAVIALTMILSAVQPVTALATAPVSALESVPGSVPELRTVNALPDPSLDRFVAPTGVDTGDCSDYTNPCETINYAIYQAATSDTVGVADGRYVYKNILAIPLGEPQRNPYHVVSIDNNVSISGGWDASFANQIGYSIIDGENTRRGIYVITTSTIDRFIIQNGFSTWANDRIDDSGLGRGAGIYTGPFSNVTISNSIIRNNSALGNYGGGIHGAGSYLTVENTGISGNSASSGAGVWIDFSHSNFRNVTISGNIATESVGGIFTYSPVIFNNVTVSDNQGGGITANGTAGRISLENSIIAKNTSFNCTNVSNYITSNGYNLIGDSCNIAFTDTDLNIIEPLLGSYLPVQGYQPLLAGSPAIDHGNPATCLTTDVRGIARVGICDIGAYEYTVPGSPASIWSLVGNYQHDGPHQAFTYPLGVAVLDNQGSPVPGVSVTFLAPAGGASIIFAESKNNATTKITDSGGTAVTSLFSANDEFGSYTVTASTPNIAEPILFGLANYFWVVVPASEGGDDENDCLAPSTPCATIAGVFSKANFKPGDKVGISIGTFDTGSISITEDVFLMGGWNTSFTDQIGASTIKDTISVDAGVSAHIQRFSITETGGQGILNNGILFLEQSAIYGNQEGIRNADTGNMTVVNTSIFDNNNPNFELMVPYAGGITNLGDSATLINVTISGNSGATGGLWSDYDTTLINTIIVGNTSIHPTSFAPDCRMSTFISIVSEGHNIIGDIGWDSLGSEYTCEADWDPTDMIGHDMDTIPAYKVLGHSIDIGNGVKVLPLFTGSIAVDAGPLPPLTPDPEICPSVDQLGVARPQAIACDIGAVEYVYPHATSGIYDDKTNVWGFYGTWPTLKISNAYSGSYRYSTAAGASATVYFSGVQVKLYYTKNSSMGNLDIYIDDVWVTKLNQKSSAARYKQIWLSPVYPDGEHKITFVRVSNKVNVDALEVIPAPDMISPAGITDLFAASATGTSYGQVNLQWTSVGDDGNTGTAASYQIRYSTSIIDTEAKWSTATAVANGLPIPASVGSPQSMTVSGLAPGLPYYFSIRAVDDGGNLSPLSNSPSAIALAPASVPAGPYDNLNSNWIYTGTWTTATTTGSFGGNVAACSIVGGSAALVFNGSGFTLRYYTKKGNGSLAVYVDGVLKTTLNQNSLSLATVWKTYVVSGLTPGTHVIQLVDSVGKVNFDNIIIAP